MSLEIDCSRAQEMLDTVLEGESSFSSALSSATPLNSQLPGELQTHLTTCAQCRDYQTASQMIVEAARVLPQMAVPRPLELTADIMAQIRDESMIVLAEAPMMAGTTSGAKSLTGLGGAESSSKSGSEIVSSVSSGGHNRQILLLLLSFSLFLTMALSGEDIDEAAWNCGAWCVALLLVALLRPFFEVRQSDTTLVAAK